jgi:hypothetical protein
MIKVKIRPGEPGWVYVEVYDGEKIVGDLGPFDPEILRLAVKEIEDAEYKRQDEERMKQWYDWQDQLEKIDEENENPGPGWKPGEVDWDEERT